MNFFNIIRSAKQMKERKWEYLTWCIDLHDVIMEGKYNLYNEGAAWCPNALKVLAQLSNHPKHRIILWTSSYDGPIQVVLAALEAHGVKFNYINENPAMPSTELCNFSRKFYFNILLDDKAGFVGSSDWYVVEEALKSLNLWEK